MVQNQIHITLSLKKQTPSKATILSCFVLERIFASFKKTLVTSAAVSVWSFFMSTEVPR